MNLFKMWLVLVGMVLDIADILDISVVFRNGITLLVANEHVFIYVECVDDLFEVRTGAGDGATKDKRDNATHIALDYDDSVDLLGRLMDATQAMKGLRDAEVVLADARLCHTVSKETVAMAGSNLAKYEMA